MTFARFFVIGGAGFIGSHLASRLAERGPVLAFDDLSSGSRENIQPAIDAGALELVQASAHDVDALCAAMQSHDVVVHLGEPDRDDAGRFVERDVAMTAAVIEAMRRRGARKLIYASSGEVYGANCEYCSEHEVSSLPPSLYGAAKLAGEALVTALSREHEIQAWIFRMGEVVGPRSQRGPVLDILRAMTGGETAALNDDPERARPFVFVDDCVEGVLFAFDRATDPLNLFNLAPGDYTAMRRVVEMCRAVLGLAERKLDWKPEAAPGGLALQRRLDPSRLDALGWQPARSSDEAVREALRRLSARAEALPKPAPSRFAEL